MQIAFLFFQMVASSKTNTHTHPREFKVPVVFVLKTNTETNKRNPPPQKKNPTYTKKQQKQQTNKQTNNTNNNKNRKTTTKKRKKKKRKKKKVGQRYSTTSSLNKRPVSAGCQNYTQPKQTNKTNDAPLIWDGGYQRIKLDPHRSELKSSVKSRGGRPGLPSLISLRFLWT